MADSFSFGKNDAGNQFSGPPYVKPDANNSQPSKTYEEVRGSDLSTSAAGNSDNLQFTRDTSGSDYLRLLMPKYSRRVEIEDLNRNFWVIGQSMSILAKEAKRVSLELLKEQTHFEVTRETDRDNHDYSNYPHRIVFNEGYEGIKTPYMVKDYCYRSIETSENFEVDCIWSRQVGGYNSPDQAYTIGGGGTIPMLNFYKPRPDAIPIFNLVQTDSSDVETFVVNSLVNVKNISNIVFVGKTDKILSHGGSESIAPLVADGDRIKGHVVTANVSELCPLTATENVRANSQDNVKVHGSIFLFENLQEGQMVISNGTKLYKKVKDSKIKEKNGLYYPEEYEWSTSRGIPTNYVDQKFYWNDGYWLNLDLLADKDGPTIPQYSVAENGCMFRVLGDTTTDIKNRSTETQPIIQGKAFTKTLQNHDVVRVKSSKVCYEWWNGKWRELQQHDDAYVNIFIWLPYKTATLRGEYYWTLKWLIPPGLGEY